MTPVPNNEFVSGTTCLENYGKGWKVIFATFGVLLVVTLIVGVFPGLMLISAAFAVVFHSVELKEGIPGTGGPAAFPEAEEPAGG